MSPRLWIATQIAKFARTLEFLAMALLRPQDLTEWNRHFFEKMAHLRGPFSPDQQGLHQEERTQIEKLFSKPGRVLVLGSGQGREAIDFAKEGWKVVAIDHSEKLLEEASRNARMLGLDLEWHHQDIAFEFPVIKGKFDLICFLGQFYHYIPSKHRRIQIVKKCRELLSEKGFFLFSVPILTPKSEQLRRAQKWRKRLGQFLGGNIHWEAGDQWSVLHEYYHSFEDLEAFDSELKKAGLSAVADFQDESELRVFKKDVLKKNAQKKEHLNK